MLLSQFQLLLSFSSFFWFLIIISLILGQNFVLSELNFYKIFLDFSINLVSILFELNLHEIFLDFSINSISTFSRILQDLIEFLWFFKLDWSPSYIAWCKCNSMVLAWLLNSLTKDIQASVIYFKSTRDLHIYNLDIQIDFPRLKLGTSRTALKKKNSSRDARPNKPNMGALTKMAYLCFSILGSVPHFLFYLPYLSPPSLVSPFK